MTPYTVPLKDMRFALRELADLDRVASLPDADALAQPDLTDAILDQAARFAEEVLAPLNTVGDRQGARWSAGAVSTPPGFADAWNKFTEAGWNNLETAADIGGQGLPALLCTVVGEMFTTANKAFSYCHGLTGSAIKTLAAHGSEVLRSVYLPKLVSGQWAATMNLTEPQAGSDVGALRTRAVPMPDGSYRISGQKIFITFGEHDFTENIVHLVLARIVGAPEGSRGISLFLVPKFLPNADGSLGARNDVLCTGIEHKLGNHGSPTCTMVYGGEGEGATGWLVGEPNRGLQAMFVMINSSRLNVGQEGVAMGELAYQLSLGHARERVQSRLPGQEDQPPVAIIEHPDVRRMLMLMRCQTEAMRALAYVLASARDLAAHHPDAAVRRERQGFLELMIPVFKGWASETGVDVSSLAIQVHGGMGYVLESGASQPLRDVRIATIYEGTTGVQAHDLIERKLVRTGGSTLRAWLNDVQCVLQALKAADAPELAGIAPALHNGVQAVQRVCDWAMAHYPQDPLRVLAGGVPLLRLLGTVAGGWQMARAALAAQRRLAQGDGDISFLHAKLASARFYAVQVLQPALALADVAEQGAQVLPGVDDAWL